VTMRRRILSTSLLVILLPLVSSVTTVAGNPAEDPDEFVPETDPVAATDRPTGSPTATPSPTEIFGSLGSTVALVPEAGKENGYLHIYLHGNNSEPSGSRLFLEFSQKAGYYTVGLDYHALSWDTKDCYDYCNLRTSVNGGNEGPDCLYNMHKQVVVGGLDEQGGPRWWNAQDSASGYPDGFVAKISENEAVLPTILKVLSGLAKHQQGNSWSQFLDSNHAVIWEKVILSGMGQGANHAAWLSLYLLTLPSQRILAKVALLSGPKDVRATGSHTNPAAWLHFPADFFIPQDRPPVTWAALEGRISGFASAGSHEIKVSDTLDAWNSMGLGTCQVLETNDPGQRGVWVDLRSQDESIPSSVSTTALSKASSCAISTLTPNSVGAPALPDYQDPDGELASHYSVILDAWVPRVGRPQGDQPDPRAVYAQETQQQFVPEGGMNADGAWAWLLAVA